jgi:hypothetical protein
MNGVCSQVDKVKFSFDIKTYEKPCTNTSKQLVAKYVPHKNPPYPLLSEFYTSDKRHFGWCSEILLHILFVM